ncbi:MAG: von Willebrand factor type A domain-containing protein, partial [Gemmatimonadota bacterium]
MKKRALAAVILSLAAVVPISWWAASSAATSASSSEVPSDVPSKMELAAPAVTFAGVVRDGDSGRPLSGAEVVLEGTSHAAMTDAAGRFFIIIRDNALLGTKVTLLVTLAGYEDARREVRVTGATVHVEFTLTPITVELDEMVVDGVANKSIAALAQDVAMYSLGPYAAARERLPGRYNPNFHTESYARIDENPWLAVENNPLSTFSIDVDRASYTNVRRLILGGDRPPVDAVRIEEMVNYFTYDYPDVNGEHPFGITTDVANAPWRPQHRLVRIGVQGRRMDLEELPPSNLVFLLDVSGSMQPYNKLPLLKKSLRLLVNELRPEDRVAIVVYAGAAGLVLPSESGREKEKILDALESLEAGGSTAGGAGIALAYRIGAENYIEGGNNRVILATDGDFNIGASSDAEMVRLIEEKRKHGIFLTVLGFGMGNLKDSKMEALADHGNGNYAYIDNLLEARKVLVTEMGGTLVTIAKDVKIQVEFNPARVQAYRLIGYENRLLADEDFNDDAKDAGELGAGHSVTALYEVVPVGAPPVETGSVDPLRYQRPEEDASETRRAGEEDELMFVKLRYKAPDGERSRLLELPVPDRVENASTDLRFSASVAAFGMLLRDSEQCGDFTLADVSRLARASLGEDRHGYRAEFVRLVEATR